MSNAAKLKKRAVELEQKKQFDKALALYIQFLEESEGALDDVDVPLYNRVGDLLLRTGNASDALNYYEKAVDLYAERGFLNNAIALCNKVLRQSPGRASIYYKLGKISATKGFKSDAKKNFLEYADRMQKAGQIDEAFRALKEFADLCPDQDDIRLMLAEQLTKENRQDEALEQLQKLHDKLDSEGRMAEARATVDRMKSIDPEAVPRVSGSYRPQKSTDLIFLDTSFEQAARRGGTPAAPPPAGRPVSDPDLVLLTLTDVPAAPVPSVANAGLPEPFSVDLGAPNDASASDPLPLLEIGDGRPTPNDLGDGIDLVIAESAAAQPASIASLDFELASEAAAGTTRDFDIELGAGAIVGGAVGEPAHQPSAFVSDVPLTVDYAGDLAGTSGPLADADGSDLFDFRGPPRSDDDGPMGAVPAGTLDPDVAFPSFDIGDMSLPSADEITSGGSIAAALGRGEFSFGMEELGDLDVPSVPEAAGSATGGSTSVTPSFTEPATVPASAAELAGSTEDLDFEWSAPAASESAATADAETLAASIDDLIVPDAIDSGPVERAGEPPPPNDTPAATALVDDELVTRPDSPGPAGDIIDLPIEDLIDAPPAEQPAASAVPNADDSVRAAADVEVVAEPTVEPAAPAARADADTPSQEESSAVVDLGGPTERMAGWEVQRGLAERLLESGDRAGGVRVLEDVAAELERIGDLERALTIVDELIRLSPDSIRHHQKRVELAFRSSDRVKLIDAYLELGDALFRAGEERKARAVYQRVLELAPDDPRARAAVESVSSMSPARGSGAIAAIPAPAPADARHDTPPARPATRETRAPQPPSTGNGSRPGAVSAPPLSRKPSPLDRAAASNGEFVDLGEWLRSGESPKSTRMVAEEKPPTGDEQADFQEMLKRFKQGVADNVDEEDYESHYDLGVAYKEMGLIDEAVAEFQKALRGTSNRVRAYEALGQCFVEKEQFQVAASVLSRAIALGEGDDHHLVGVLYLLGRATEALDRNRDALDYYQRVFAVDIEFRDVAERISAIERKAT